MRNVIVAALVFTFAIPATSRAEEKPLRTLDQAAARLAALAARPLRPYATRDFGREKNPAARSVVVAEEKADEVLRAVRRELGPGLIAFIGCTNSLADPKVEGSEVVVAEGKTQFDVLRVAASDAVNLDMDTEDLVKKLEEWDKKYGIDIFHAETDTIEFEFRKLPPNLRAFCRDLYKFCPDIVDQGTGTIKELEAEIKDTKRVFLWWD